MSQFNEEDFVDYLRKITADNSTARPGDDCAVLGSFSPPLLLTTDSLVRGIHYDENYRPAEIARKLAGVNVSDIAAMGGEPKVAVASYCGGGSVKKLSKNLTESLADYGVELVGGDLSQTPEKSQETFALTMLGRTSKDGLLRRDKAQPGEILAVSGRLGGPAAVLAANATANVETRELLYRVDPEVELGQQLVRRGCSCGIDVSDGLLKDLRRICRASGVGARIEPEKLPVHPRAKDLTDNRAEALKLGLTGGEDYVLLFSLDAEKYELFKSDQLFKIGLVTAGHDVEFTSELPFDPADISSGYDHF